MGHDRTRRLEEAARPTQARGGQQAAAHPVIALQQSLGNSATTSLLRSMSDQGNVLAREKKGGGSATADGGAATTTDFGSIPGRKFHMSASNGKPAEQGRLLEFVRNRLPAKNVNNASQAVNDVTSGRGKHGGEMGDFHVFHASAGDGQTSCTVWFIRAGGDVVSLLAIGSHVKATTYEVHWSSDDAADRFPVGKTIGPTGA